MFFDSRHLTLSELSRILLPVVYPALFFISRAYFLSVISRCNCITASEFRFLSAFFLLFFYFRLKSTILLFADADGTCQSFFVTHSTKLFFFGFLSLLTKENKCYLVSREIRCAELPSDSNRAGERLLAVGCCIGS